MDLQEIVKLLGDNTELALKQAMKCKTPEELIKLASEYKIELKEDEASKLFSSMNAQMKELTEDELDAVTGAGDKVYGCNVCGSTDIVSYPPASYRCRKCGHSWWFGSPF